MNSLEFNLIQNNWREIIPPNFHEVIEGFIKKSIAPCHIIRPYPKGGDMMSGQYKVDVYGVFDLRDHPQIKKRTDLPANIEFHGDLVIPDDLKLSMFIWPNTNIDGVRAHNIVRIPTEKKPVPEILSDTAFETKRATVKGQMVAEDFDRELALLPLARYADFLSAHGLPAGYDNWQKDVTVVYEALTTRPEFRGMSRAQKIRIFDDYRERHGPLLQYCGKKMTSACERIDEEKIPGIFFVPDNSENGFHDFRLNEWHSEFARDAKAFITLKDPVFDLTPENFKGIMQLLADSGLRGHLKIPVRTMSMLYRLENITLYAETMPEVIAAVQVVTGYLRNKGIQMAVQPSYAIDEVDISANQALAIKIQNELLKK